MVTPVEAPRTPSRIERFAPLMAGVALAIPTLLARYLPMSDLPLHEGVVGLLRHYGDPAYMPDGLYALNLGHPNQLFHVTAALLSFVVSTSMAVKLVVAAAQIGIFIGGARLADYLGRSRWSVLLLAPLALGFTYYWGLVANLVGFAGFLLALPTIDRETRTPSLRGVLVTSSTLLLLFFAHESVFVCTALVVGVLTILLPLSWRATSLRMAPAAFSAVVAIGHQLWQKQFYTAGQPQAPTGFFTEWQRVRYLPNALFGTYELIEQLLLLGLGLIGIGFLFSERLRESSTWRGRSDGPAEPPATTMLSRLRRLRALLDGHRFELIGALHLGAYFVVPFNWHGATLIHERFLGPAWALIAITAAPRVSVKRLGWIVSAVVPVGILLLSWPQFVDADRTYRDLDALIARIPKNAAVTQTVLDKPTYRTRAYSASTGPARIVAERGGRIGLSLLISPISPIQLRPEWRWNEYDIRTTNFGSKMLKPASDLQLFEWVVAQSRDAFTRDLIIIALSPEADFVMAKGEWLLFHSRKPVLPLLSKEIPPLPSMETALDRVYQLSIRHGDEVREGSAAPTPSGAE
jgi:hypothetical protein